MLTGFNTDVDYEGRTFHVQTEDKGPSNPWSRASFTRAGRSWVPAEHLRRPHGGVGAVRGGTPSPHGEPAPGRDPRDPERPVRSRGPKPFGYNIITNRSLDEVVLDFLAGAGDAGRIRLEMEDLTRSRRGRTRRSSSACSRRNRSAPCRRARGGQAALDEGPSEGDLLGTTATDGRVEATIELPEADGVSSAVLCQAEASGNNAELKRLVGKPPRRVMTAQPRTAPLARSISRRASSLRPASRLS